MKLALVVPNCPTYFGDIGPPLNLAILAAYVRQQLPDCEIKIFDGTIKGVSVYDKIMEFRPDVVGATATSPQVNSAYKLLDNLRAVKPEILTVIGGCHVSALSNEASAHADCVVAGEGEHAIVDVLRRKQENLPIPKIIEGTPFEDLDELPLPAYDLLDMKSYMYFVMASALGLEHPTGRMMTSRGCNYRCPFCYNSVRQSRVRYRSAKKIVEELEYLHEHYGIKSVWYHDDEFLSNKKRFKEFVALLADSRIKEKKMEWACQGRVDSINEETVKLAKDNGCIEIFMGIESATPKTLNYLKCGTITVEDVERALKICKKYNLPVHGSFIFGAPNETLADMKQTWSWINKHRCLMVSIGVIAVTPFPASKLWEYMKGKQINYDNLGFHGELSQKYIIDEAITLKDFEGFMKDKVLLTWLGNQIATKPLWRAMAHKTSGLLLLKHPVDTLQIIWSKRL